MFGIYDKHDNGINEYKLLHMLALALSLFLGTLVVIFTVNVTKTDPSFNDSHISDPTDNTIVYNCIICE